MVLGVHSPIPATEVVGQARVITPSVPADEAFRIQEWWDIKKAGAPVEAEGKAWLILRFVAAGV